MLALVMSRVPIEWHISLAAIGWTMRFVIELSEFWWYKHLRCIHDQNQRWGRTVTQNQRWGRKVTQNQRWGRMVTKLGIFQLEQFSKVLYLDSDALLLGRADAVFEIEGCAAKRGLSAA
uniref:Uncharacterized protein n=1 Tax=Haptolina brevifila TaxID=156173 RepID=A0A7S2DD72_9EUKA|mmetsp:Transcript_3674/g.7956  ORF Transcript_3674/g.7956 Transcript_3674/m.7956 type:complete len:119 (+) Transcript_3674:499-855(+)